MEAVIRNQCKLDNIKLIKLDIGCGLHPKEPVEEWIHLDINDGQFTDIKADFRKIPLSDGVVNAIYIGDVIEHIPKWDYDLVFKEWNRIAKIGCILSGATPNGPGIMKEFVAGKKTFLEAITPNLLGWGDRPTEVHYNIFSRETLNDLLVKYGWDTVDYSGSPGCNANNDEPWWLVFETKKVKDIPITSRDYGARL